MPTTPWSAQRERQYLHVKKSLLEQGKPAPVATEIAARVVHKARASHGESAPADDASPKALPDPPPRTLRQLRQSARERGVKGRSAMTRAALEAALDRSIP